MFIVCIFCPFLTQTTTTTPTTRERELGEKNKNINESLKRDMAYHQAREKRKGKWKLAKSRHRQKTLIKIFQLQGSRTDEINTEINLLMLESLCEKQWFAEFQRGISMEISTYVKINLNILSSIPWLLPISVASHIIFMMHDRPSKPCLLISSWCCKV